MQIKPFKFRKKHVKHLNSYVYISSWTKQIILGHIYIWFSQINI
jgi:hypothetical protein